MSDVNHRRGGRKYGTRNKDYAGCCSRKAVANTKRIKTRLARRVANEIVDGSFDGRHWRSGTHAGGGCGGVANWMKGDAGYDG